MAKKQRGPPPTSKKQEDAPEEGRFSINTIKRPREKAGTPLSTSKKQEAQEEGRFSINTIRRKLREYQRILTLTRRPTREEFSTIAKVAAIGIVIIGAVGFVIYLAMVQAPANLGLGKNANQTAPAGTQVSTIPSEINNTTSNFTSVFTNSTQISTTG